ncbi:MAG TPA: TolC family protein [Candidatus Binataceae bacterium]|nr:TolC family protein [Candidatus Binataceae bacterium]
MSVRTPALAAVVVALIATTAAAQDGSVSRISLDDAITAALRDNRELRASADQRRAVEDEVDVARAAMIPRLDALENFSYTDSPVQVFSNLLAQQEFTASNFAINSLNHPAFLSNFQSQARLSFPLFAGGRLLAGLRDAGLAAHAERWQSIRTRQQVEFAVIQSFFSALIAEQQVAVIKRASDAARAHLGQAQNLFANGMVVKSDVLRTNVLVGTIEQQRIEAESRVAISRAQLAHVLGEEDRRIAPLDNKAATASIPQASSLDAMTKNAMAARPEIKVIDDGVGRAREAVAMARADYLPTVEIAGVYENDSQTLARAGQSGALMISGRLNLFNGMATRAKFDAAQADLSRTKALAEDLRHAIALEVETAYRRLAAAQQSLEVAERDAVYAADSLKTLEDRYGAGLATNIAVLDAQTTREETEMRLVAARAEVNIDRAALNLAVGIEPQSAMER